MKKWILLVLLSGLVLSCSKKDKTEVCGAKKYLIINKTLRGCENGDTLPCLALNKADPLFDTYMEGNNRVFSWSYLVENACTYQHVVAYCKVMTEHNPSGVTARGEIWTSAWYQPAQITMTQSGNEISGQGEAGLKQVYGDGPGKFLPVIEVLFPTKGSFSADSLFFYSEVYGVSLQADFMEYLF